MTLRAASAQRRLAYVDMGMHGWRGRRREGGETMVATQTSGSAPARLAGGRTTCAKASGTREALGRHSPGSRAELGGGGGEHGNHRREAHRRMRPDLRAQGVGVLPLPPRIRAVVRGRCGRVADEGASRLARAEEAVPQPA